jgi:hypothetical protein
LPPLERKGETVQFNDGVGAVVLVLLSRRGQKALVTSFRISAVIRPR